VKTYVSTAVHNTFQEDIISDIITNFSFLTANQTIFLELLQVRLGSQLRLREMPLLLLSQLHGFILDSL